MFYHTVGSLKKLMFVNGIFNKIIFLISSKAITDNDFFFHGEGKGSCLQEIESRR